MIDSPLVRPPRPQAVRMAAWAPARVRIPRAAGVQNLGDSSILTSAISKVSSFFGITLDETVFISAGIGGAAILLADAFDPPISVAVKVGGFGGIAYGIYHMIEGGPPKPPPSTPGAQQPPLPTPSPQAFELIRGTFVSPSTGTQPPLNRSLFSPTSFNATIIWSNGSGDVVDFTYDVFANIVGRGLVQPGVNQISKTIYSSTVHIDKGTASTGPVVIALPIMQPPQPGLTGAGLAPPTFTMTLVLRKYDVVTGAPVEASQPITVGPFQYGAFPVVS